MHTEIFNNIDLLVKMSGSLNNIDDISTELISLKKEISDKKSEIDDLKSLMLDSRYFNASLELVDKNIEISLKNKIKGLNKKVKNLENTIEDIKSSENSMHTEIEKLKSKLEKNEDYVEVLRKKAQNKENKYYKKLLDKEKKNVELLNKELEKKNKRYLEILKELELNNQAYIELTEELEDKNNRLEDILNSLNNPNSYIDLDLKNSDEDKLKALNNELTALEKKKVEYLTDAIMVGADAKELILDDDITEALNKIKELVTIVKAKPFMDITSLSVLDEELEKKESQRTELANLIDNKNYEELESSAVKNRISYIEEEILECDKSIDSYRMKIEKIDKFINDKLGNVVSLLEEEVLKKEELINKYREMHKDNNKSVRSKVNLENAILKKLKEKKILDELLVSYKDSLVNKIKETNVLNELIKSLEDNKSEYEEEIKELNKINLKDFRTKDLLEEEFDKERLRELNEEIRQLKIRKEYNKLPDEIFDELEMTLASLRVDSFEVLNKEKETNVDKYEGVIIDEIPTREESNTMNVVTLNDADEEETDNIDIALEDSDESENDVVILENNVEEEETLNYDGIILDNISDENTIKYDGIISDTNNEQVDNIITLDESDNLNDEVVSERIKVVEMIPTHLNEDSKSGGEISGS